MPIWKYAVYNSILGGPQAWILWQTRAPFTEINSSPAMDNLLQQ